MRLRADQLHSHIQRSSLLPIYLISGDEPLQLLESSDQIRHAARENGYEERVVLEVDKTFNWNSLLDESAALSLFASQKIMELKMGTHKPGRDGGKTLTEYAENIPEGNLLLITCGKLDKSAQNTKWFKSLDKHGATVLVWPIEASQLPSWILQRVKSLGKTIDKNTAEFIAARVEGNLMAASQEISKLCLLVESKQIELDDVLNSVVDSSRYDVFSLMEAAYLGDLNRLSRMLQGLKSEGLDPMAIYGALMWEFRRLCSMAYQFQQTGNLEQIFSAYRIWNNGRKQAIQKVLRRHNLARLHELLIDVIKIDRLIKSSDRINAWNALLDLLIQIGSSSQQKLAN